MKTPKSSDSTREPFGAMSDIAEAARKNCEQALHTGLKFQEETGRWWSSVLSPSSFAQTLQEQFNSMARAANRMLPLTQKPLSDLVDLAEKNSRVSAELIHKALDAVQTTSASESQAKWTEFWTASVHAARANNEALSQIGCKTLDSWASFIRTSPEGNDNRAKA